MITSIQELYNRISSLNKISNVNRSGFIAKKFSNVYMVYSESIGSLNFSPSISQELYLLLISKFSTDINRLQTECFMLSELSNFIIEQRMNKLNKI